MGVATWTWTPDKGGDKPASLIDTMFGSENAESIGQRLLLL